MSGRLGAYDLTGGVAQSLYQGDTAKFTAVTVNITNRGNESVMVYAAITDLESVIDPQDYIEFGVELLPKGTLERTGIIVPSTKYLTVKSTHSTVSAVAWGIRTGDTISVTPIAAATNAAPPTWVTPTTITWPGTDRLYARDEGAVTYAIVSGSLPGGLRLRSSGRIDGPASAIGLNSTVTISATNPSGNSVNRTFDVTTEDTQGHVYIT